MAVQTTGEMRIIIQMPENAGGDTQSVNNGNSPVTPQDATIQTSNPVKGNNNSQAALATAIQATKTVGSQAINAAISNIGISSGNYYAQRQSQNAISLVSTIGAIAMSASNPITLAVSVASMAISVGSQYYQQQKQINADNYQTAQYAKRLGYTVGRK